VPVQFEDAPGFDNISEPSQLKVRDCMDFSFTTYIVFEDAAGTLTSLGWMSWDVGATVQRNDGTCPRKTTTNDCAGWMFGPTVVSKASNFTVGAMDPQQPLDRAVKIVSANQIDYADCSPTACPNGNAPSPAPSAPSPAPSK
jgi:hypothetical protein